MGSSSVIGLAGGGSQAVATPSARIITVDIADMHVCDDPKAALITYSLGSCIGVTLWDPVRRVGGMIHFMLPEAKLNPEKAKVHPAMFADSGIPALFKAAYALGASKERLVVKAAGGSQLLDDAGTFNIGKRNYAALRKLFWQNGVLVSAEDVGGSVSRTLRLDVGTGRVTLKARGMEVELQ